MIGPLSRENLAASHDLPPAQCFCRTAQLTNRGIVLGEGIIVAQLMRRADTTYALAVEGREAEIFALLSLVHGEAIRPNVLYGLYGVAKSLAQGEIVSAMIRLAQIGLPPLRGPRDAEMLKTGATFLAKGFSPWAILHAAGIEGVNVRLFKAEWDENRHPRDPANGRFIETGAGTIIAASAAQSLIAGGAMQVSVGVFALAGGALLSLTAAGWVLSHGPKGNIEDGPGYWLPGVSSDDASDANGKDETPSMGHNGGPALDQAGDQQPQGPNEKRPSIIPPGTLRREENKGSVTVDGWSDTPSLSASENALSHWNKHSSEFPEYSSAGEYTKAAQIFVQDPPDGTLSKTRANGDTLLYDPHTNTFAVSSVVGAPRTMFRPRDASSYWRNIK